MKSCPHCGEGVAEGSHFCPHCGLRLLPEAVSAPPARRHRGRRVVLTFLLVVSLIGVIFVVGVVYFIRHTTIVSSSRAGGRVESPFGVVSSGNDPAKLARSLGVDVFPGAVGVKGAQADLVNSQMVSLTFRTSATPHQVISFYHIRYPDSQVTSRGRQISLVQVNLRDTLTIRASPVSGHTEIFISDVSH